MLIRPAGPHVPAIIVRLTPAVVGSLKEHVGYTYRSASERESDGRDESIEASEADSLEGLAEVLDLTDLGAFLENHPRISSQRLIEAPLTRLWDWEGDAADAAELAPLRSLSAYYALHYWWLRAEPGAPPDRIGPHTLRKLQALDDVDLAYFEPEMSETTSDPGFFRQTYLHGVHLDGSDESGINAIKVWPTYDGTGIGFADLERGWHLGHADFPKKLTVLNGKDVVTAHADHGTQAVGAVIAVHNNCKGIAGIAPGADVKGVLSFVTLDVDAFGAPIEVHNLTGAIIDALDHLAVGDVLQIEIQALESGTFTGGKKGRPVETVPSVFDAIRLVTALGRIVIEPAGNDGIDLDGAYPKLKRGGPGDSGAIMVSGCDHLAVEQDGVVVHLKDESVCQGTRVDCHGWSGFMYTSQEPFGAGTLDYGSWGGTSAAVSMISGAALLAQQMHTDVFGTRASPTKLRSILSTYGTPVAGVKEDPTHVLPDLEMIQTAFNALPEVFIRDSVLDDGQVPSASVSQSPDIFVKSLKASDRVAAYGAPSPLADQVPANDPVQADTENFVYVRMLNRGTKQATGARAAVFWAESSTLLTPDVWQPVGTTAPTDVPPGSVLTVAPPIVWKPSPGDLPPDDHGCFIAVLDHPDDPMPVELPDTVGSTGAGITWDHFMAYVGSQNNVAWRNFNFLKPTEAEAEPDESLPLPEEEIEVQTDVGGQIPECHPTHGAGHDGDHAGSSSDEATHSSGTQSFEARFRLRAFDDERHRYDLEVIRDLPEGSALHWDVPRSVATAIGHAGLHELNRLDLPDVISMVIPERRFPRGGRLEGGEPSGALERPSLHRFRGVKLPRGRGSRCRFRIRVPAGAERAEVAIRQLFDGVEVGRITYRLLA